MNNPSLIKTFVAATAVESRRIVALDAADNSVKQASANSDPIIGVSAEPKAVASGARIDVAHTGIVEVTAGASVTKGAWLTSDANGKAVTAGADEERIGRALTAANADGDIISVEIAKNS